MQSFMVFAGAPSAPVRQVSTGKYLGEASHDRPLAQRVVSDESGRRGVADGSRPAQSSGQRSNPCRTPRRNIVLIERWSFSWLYLSFFGEPPTLPSSASFSFKRSQASPIRRSAVPRFVLDAPAAFQQAPT